MKTKRKRAKKTRLRAEVPDPPEPLRSHSANARRTKARRKGLEHWMRRVLKECARAARLEPDPVHDLRVALRRCRSLAGGVMTVDPHPQWRAMRKAGKGLFRQMGRLRDLHVMMDWVRKLAPANDPARQKAGGQARKKLLAMLAEQEPPLQAEAKAALGAFHHHKWKKWTHALPKRARRLPPDGLVFQHLALERWQEAYELHRRAMRNRSQVSFHRARIGLKRFRYTVENFLPSRAAWLPDLKKLQDVLGEAHDLDVLEKTYFGRRRFFSERTRARWRRRIERERDARLAKYRERMKGRKSLWHVWRAGLPDGPRLEEASMSKLRAWASFLDPNFRHSERVAHVALQLYDGLAARLSHNIAGANGRARRSGQARQILEAAALVHDVGRAKGSKGHHKTTYRLVTGFPPPLGWSRQALRRTALVARYHRGAEPRSRHHAFATLSASTRKRVAYLGGVLRLADALVRQSNNGVSALRVEEGADAIVIRVRGIREGAKSAAIIGGRKHLLETVLRRPILVRS